MVEGACLENRCTATYRGFESLTHRNPKPTLPRRLFLLFVRDQVLLTDPSIPLHPQGTGERIPPHGFAVPLLSALRASESNLLVVYP